MPSLQQLRYETFADRVDRATASSLLLSLVGVRAEPLNVRVETREAVTFEMRLDEVDVDGAQLVGRSPTGAPLRFPLGNAKAVWQHRRMMGRALSLWFATLLASMTGGLVAARVTHLGSGADGALVGALLGAIAGIGVMLLSDKWEALYEWIPLYDSAMEKA